MSRQQQLLLLQLQEQQLLLLPVLGPAGGAGPAAASPAPAWSLFDVLSAPREPDASSRRSAKGRRATRRRTRRR
jgi:hypothetical protein